MSEEGSEPQVLGEFEVDSPDHGWWDTNGSLEGRVFDLADSTIRLFDHTRLNNESILLIEKWSQLLQSGKYAQGQEYLCQLGPNDNVMSYCCLALPFLDENWFNADEGNKVVFGLEYYNEGADVPTCNTLSLPPAFFKKLALFDPVGMFRETGERKLMPISLANVNDELGWNFKKIGKLITVKLLQAEDEKRNATIASGEI